jgi:methionine-rich copper-binding protein CopC
MFPLTILSAAAAAAPTFVPVAAQAQPKPASSTPATDAVAATSEPLELRSSKRLIAKRSGAAIVMPGMMRIKPMAVPVLAAQAGLDRNAQGVAAKAPSGAGTDKPGWHLVTADKHRVQGGFEFTAR